ncbi:MAG: ATP-binding cassette domain-containing protein, partial [Bacteroidetes bacterium]|nr:ATP-binding cassette domain-containing protein [Bacteroidota bacterium]
GNKPVLNNINLQVPVSSIYGFLGPNGAGKTTTLRLLLGLLRKQQGSIKVFGKEFQKNRINILKNIGSLIESPSIYLHLTASENLEVLQKIYRCPERNIGETLEIVGLEMTGNKKAGQFSLGMKQRLSIAIAMFHKPSLLILDEPTNGLDPNGIIEIRELLRKLNNEFKTTIVISSHMLTEIEKLVTHIGVIKKGSILFQGTLHELRQKQMHNSVIHFDTSENDKAGKIILANGVMPISLDDQITLPRMERETIAKLNRQLVEKGIEVYQISTSQKDLESIFIDFIKP